MERVFAVVLIEEYEAPHYERFFVSREAAEAYVSEHDESFSGYGHLEVWEHEVS